MTDNKIQEYIDGINAKYEELDRADQEAKEKGTIVGRYVREPIADGYAYYRVVNIHQDQVTLEHIAIGDAWTVPFIESMNRVLPLHYVQENIRMRDGLKKLFA